MRQPCNRPTYRSAVRWLARILRGSGFVDEGARGLDLVTKAGALACVALVAKVWNVTEGAVIDDASQAAHKFLALNIDNACIREGFHPIQAHADTRPIATSVRVAPLDSMALSHAEDVARERSAHHERVLSGLQGAA